MAEGLPLSVSGLGVKRGRRVVLADLGFSAEPGSITVLLGPNGAGKSTALKAILRLLDHDGVVQLGGRDSRELEAIERARLVAYVPQHSALDAPLPVRDVVAQGRFAHGSDALFSGLGPGERQRVESALERTDLSALAERPFNALSYGERRRVLLARALCTEAPLLLLDEPTAALDVAHALRLFRVLADVAAGGTAVVLVLHQLQEAAAIAQRAVLLSEGRCVKQGPVAEVLSAEVIRSVYGVELVPAAQFGCRLVEGLR